MLEPDVPIIVPDAQPGSAGDFLNRYADDAVARWAATANAPHTDEGIYERDVTLDDYDELVASFHEEADRIAGLGIDLATDPLP